MNILSIIAWVWLFLGGVTILIFRFYTKVTHDMIRKEFAVLNGYTIKNPVLFYYLFMIMLGAFIFFWICFYEIRNLFKGE